QEKPNCRNPLQGYWDGALAGVFDGENCSLFVNGRLAQKAKLNGAFEISSFPMLIGARPARGAKIHRALKGVVDDVRISEQARYLEDFTPPERFERDRDTMALYHLDEGSGNLAHDSSWNHRHGTIIGAEWIDEEPAPLVADTIQPPIEVPEGAVDLLSLVDPERDTVSGECGLDGATLVLWNQGLLQIPYILPEEYDLQLTAQRIHTMVDKEEALRIGVVVGQTQAVVVVDGSGRWTGLGNVDGKSPGQRAGQPDVYEGRLLPHNVSVTIRIEVRKTPEGYSVRSFAGERELCYWQGGPDCLGLLPKNAPISPDVASLGTYASCGFRIPALHLVPVSSEGRPVFSPESTASADRIAAERILWKGGTVSLSLDDGSDADVRQIKDLPTSFKLIGVSLRAAENLTEDDLGSLVGLHDLRRVVFGSVGLSSVMAWPILKSTPKLEELDLSVKDLREEDLSGLTQLPALRRLVLKAVQLDESSLASIAGCSRLESLVLTSSNVSDEQLRYLAQLPVLNELDLRLTGISDFGLANLTECGALGRLRLAGTSISDQGLQDLQHMTSLEELDLRGTEITDEGISVLAELTSLRRLSLDYTPITDGALPCLSALRNLTYLSLMDTDVTDIGVASLHKLSQLEKLNVLGTDVTQAAIDRLISSLPQCRVERNSQKEIDLVKLIDPGRHAESGSWKILGGSPARQSPSGYGCLRIPFSPPREYVLEVTAVRRDGTHALCLGLLRDGRQFTVRLGGTVNGRRITGLDLIDARECPDNETRCTVPLFPRGTPTTVRVLVRGSQISVSSAGQMLVDWDGSPERLAPPEPVSGPRSHLLSLNVYGYEYSICRLKLIPIQGSGAVCEYADAKTLVRETPVKPRSTVGEQPPTEFIDLMSQIDLERDRISGLWFNQGNALVGAPVGCMYATLRFPYCPPDEYDLWIEVERLWNSMELLVPIAMAEHTPRLLLDISGSRSRWWKRFEKQSLQSGKLMNRGEICTIICTVRRSESGFSLRVSHNGTKLLDWNGDPAVVTQWGPAQKYSGAGTQLGLSFRSAFRIHGIRLVPHSGDGRTIEFGKDTATPDRKAAVWVLWKGGNVRISLDGQSPTTVGRISELPPSFELVSISLRGNRDFSGPDFAYLSGLKSLEELDLANSAVTDDDIQCINGLPHLRELDLSCTGVTDDGLSKLRDCAALEDLNIAGTRVTDAGLEYLQTTRSLRRLNLTGLRVTDFGLASLQSLESLQTLVLDDTLITDRGFGHLIQCKSLGHLSLIGTPVSDVGLSTLADVTGLVQVCAVGTHCTGEVAALFRKSVPDCEIVSGNERAVDLLSLLAPDPNSLRGQWAIEDGTLQSANAENSQIAIPYAPPDEYVLDLIGERAAGLGPISLGLVALHCRFVLNVDGFEDWRGGRTWLAAIDGNDSLSNETTCQSAGFSPGDEFALRVVVRRSGVTVLADEQCVLQWSGDYQRLSLPEKWAALTEPVLFLGADQAEFQIRKLKLTPISGKGKIVDLPDANPSPEDTGTQGSRPDDGSPKQKGRYAVPDGGVDELLAFMEAVWQFKPGNDKERKEYQEKAFNAIHAAASRIHALENDPESEAVRKATMILLDFQVRVPGSRDRQQLAALIKAIAAGTDPTDEDVAQALSLGRALEQNKQSRNAAKMYSLIAQVADKQEDVRWNAIREIAEGTKRRLELVGKPFDLGGIQTDNTRFNWDDYRGKFVLVHFLTSWCIHCRNEIPNIRNYYDLYHDRGFDVVDISLDEDRKALQRYLDEEQLPWVTLHEKEAGWKSFLSRYYGIRAVPTMLLVDKQGKVVSLNARGDELGKLLAQFLGPAGAEAGVLARAKKWDEAGRQYQALARLNPSNVNHWRALVACRLQSNDVEGYRTACKGAFASLSKSYIWARATLVQLCAFGPDCGVDRDALSRIATDVLRQSDNNTMKLAKGMMDYRCGRFEEALANLPGRHRGDSLQKPCNLFFQAMTHHRLDSSQQAQILLRNAIQEVQRRVPAIDGPPLDSQRIDRWIVWATVDAVRREATATIPVDLEQTNGALDVPKAIDETTVAIEKSGDDATLFVHRGGLHARLGHWKEAAADYAKAVELEPDNDIYWLRAAPLLALADDLEGYRRLCRQMIERFGATKEPGQADKTIKACLLLPGTEVPDSLRQVLETALDGGKAPKWFYGWGYATQALMSFRDGDAEDAVRWVRKSQETETYAEFGSLRAFALLLLSMAQHELEKEDEARKSYDEALKLIYDHLNEPIGDDPANIEHDWLIAQIIRREAEKRLGSKKTP
nr:redoxin family protein [Planctomycetota bacterium]